MVRTTTETERSIDRMTCTGCRLELAANDALFNDEGQHVCDSCFGQEDLAKTFNKGTQGYAGTTIGFGLMSWFINPFFVFSILGVIAAVRGLTFPARIAKADGEHLQHASWVMPGCVIGLILIATQVTFALSDMI